MFLVGSVIVLWLLGVLAEITDMLDGIIARRNGEVTDLGKVLDPFADVITRITYFLCFTGIGIMPIWILTILVYRELGITFLRMIMIRNGIAMPANIWGKSKAITYMVAGIAGLSVVTIQRTGLFSGWIDPVRLVALIIFVLAGAASIGSFLTYAVQVVRKLRKKTS